MFPEKCGLVSELNSKTFSNDQYVNRRGTAKVMTEGAHINNRYRLMSFGSDACNNMLKVAQS